MTGGRAVHGAEGAEGLLALAFDRAVRLAGRGPAHGVEPVPFVAPPASGIEPVAGIEPVPFAARPTRGIEPVAGIEPVFSQAGPEDLLRFAVRVIEVGLRVLAEPPCPPAWVRRGEAVFRERARPLAAARSLLRLAFDSWAGHAALAARGGGGARFVRFGEPGAAVDLELLTFADGSVRLSGALDVAPGARAAATSVEIRPARGRGRRVRVRAPGAFEADLPASFGAFSLVVRRGGRVQVRTARVRPVRTAAKAGPR